ncbi:response regulator [soil metagenome]
MPEPMQILLAEDNPDDASLLSEVLRDTKIAHVLNVVDDGMEAIRYLRQQGRFASAVRPDLLLLDLNMPRMNGFEVLEGIRAAGPRGLAIVVLTVSEDQEEIVKAMQLSMNYYIRKPVDLEQLRELLVLVDEMWRVR